MKKPPVALLLAVPALACSFAACGSSSGDSGSASAEDEIVGIIEAVSADANEYCDHVSDATLRTLGGMDHCRDLADTVFKEEVEGIEAGEVEVKGDRATATITKDGERDTVRFAREDGEWRMVE